MRPRQSLWTFRLRRAFVAREIYELWKCVTQRLRITFEWTENGMRWAQRAGTKFGGKKDTRVSRQKSPSRSITYNRLQANIRSVNWSKLARSFKADWLLLLASLNNSSISSMRLRFGVGWILTWGVFCPPGFRTSGYWNINENLPWGKRPANMGLPDDLSSDSRAA